MTVANILTIGCGEYEEFVFVLFPILRQRLPGHFSCPLMEDHVPINID